MRSLINENQIEIECDLIKMFFHLPMNCQRINDYWYSLLGRHVAEPFDEDKVDNRLVVAQASIQRDVDVVGLNWNRRRDCAVER